VPLGTSGNDTFNGTAANDVFDGLGGNDIIRGQDGDDTLNGGDGNDVLDGGTGRDTLNGEKGDDVLTGGADTDWFWLASTGTGHDIVTDFENGLDKVRITGIAGVDDFSDLAVSDNGAGGAVITLPDGSTLTLEGVAAADVDAGDFLWV
jgi:Ca2+-binding RTX toxin-like protein